MVTCVRSLGGAPAEALKQELVCAHLRQLAGLKDALGPEHKVRLDFHTGAVETFHLWNESQLLWHKIPPGTGAGKKILVCSSYLEWKLLIGCKNYFHISGELY